MAHRMSVPCPVCGAVPPEGGAGPRRAIAAVARHVARQHPHVTAAERELLAASWPPPRRFVDAVLATQRD